MAWVTPTDLGTTSILDRIINYNNHSKGKSKAKLNVIKRVLIATDAEKHSIQVMGQTETDIKESTAKQARGKKKKKHTQWNRRNERIHRSMNIHRGRNTSNLHQSE